MYTTSNLLKLNLEVLAFSGLPGSGKDTAAAQVYCPEKHIHLKFSNIVYDMAASLLGTYEADFTHRILLSDRKVKGYEVMVGGRRMTIRQVLQGFNSLKDYFGNSVYVDALSKQLFRAATERDISGVIISDLRFKEEYDWLRYIGGQLIYIERPDLVSDPDVLSHVSESNHEFLRDNADAVIQNNGTKQDLKNALIAALDKDALVAVQ